MGKLLLGDVYSLKSSLEEIRGELIPSFDQVLESWIRDVQGTKYADPKYFLEITYLTEPLKLFVKRISSSLRSVGVFGGSLERGFGFGKTHSLILLWHLFTSDIGRELDAEVPLDVVRETLTLGFDFSKEKPLTRLVSILEAYADMRHPVVKVKDPKLVQAVSQVLSRYGKSELYSLSNDELAELIIDIMEKYNELGKRPRLLLLIDELGYGLAQRARKYADYLDRGEKGKASEVYSEANSVINFLSYLYEKLQGKPYSSVIIWVLAEQDRREVNALLLKYQDKGRIYSKIKGLMEDLDSLRERYNRGFAGTGIAELSYSPEHAIEIALYRVLRAEVAGLDDVREAYFSNLKLVANQLNLRDALEKYKGEIRRFYPFSLGLVRLFKKIMNPRDMPGTEYVRTVLYIAAEAAEKALKKDASNTYTISLKHLGLPESVQARLTGELEADWIQAISDVEISLARIEDEYRAPGELAAKYIFAKGVTANILVLLEPEDAREIDRYGSTLDEIQLEIIQSHKESDAFKLLENLDRALERIRAESARIDEREIRGKRYYLPSFFTTIYSKLTAYVLEERREMEKETIPLYFLEKGTIPSLLANVKVVVNGRHDDVSVSLLEFNKIWDTNVLTSHQGLLRAQREGKLLLVMAPPWDFDLYNRLYRGETSYDQLIEGLAERLQATVDRGFIQRPLHIIVLIPNLSRHRLDRLLDKLVVYEGTKRFLQYLEKSSDVLMERLREYEGTLTKRRNLVEILNSELKEKHLARLRSKLEKEISEARRLAQRQLVNLSREIVVEILSLYSKVIYYSLDENRFVVKRLTPPSLEAETPSGSLGQYEVPKSLEKYTSILNGFLRGIIIGLHYQYKPMDLMRAILDQYKREFRSSPIRESDRIEEVVENLLQGAYGVKPLSKLVAREAVKLLNKQIIEYDDKSVEIKVDEARGLILFNVIKKEEAAGEQFPPPVISRPPLQAKPAISTQEGQPATTTTIKPVKEAKTANINLELPPGFNVDDLQQKLTVFLEHHHARIEEVTFKLITDKSSLTFSIREADIDSLRNRNSKIILNLLSRLSAGEAKAVTVSMKLGEPISEKIVKEVFEDYYAVRRSFDRFLP